MRFSLLGKIWVTMFSILCMLTSTFAYSLSAMPLEHQQMKQEHVNCSMQVPSDTHAHHHLMDNDAASDCHSKTDSMSDCCTKNCTMASAMILPTMLDLSVSVTNSPQLSSLIVAEVNHPSNSLFRPPIL